MKINSSKISALIKKQIENFNLNIEADDVGNFIRSKIKWYQQNKKAQEI